MSGHYCCKRCGLRYDDCECGKPAAEFPVTGIPASPYRELIAELRKPMHYLSTKKRHQIADILEAQ